MSEPPRAASRPDAETPDAVAPIRADEETSSPRAPDVEAGASESAAPDDPETIDDLLTALDTPWVAESGEPDTLEPWVAESGEPVTPSPDLGPPAELEVGVALDQGGDTLGDGNDELADAVMRMRADIAGLYQRGASRATGHGPNGAGANGAGGQPGDGQRANGAGGDGQQANGATGQLGGGASARGPEGVGPQPGGGTGQKPGNGADLGGGGTVVEMVDAATTMLIRTANERAAAGVTKRLSCFKIIAPGITPRSKSWRRQRRERRNTRKSIGSTISGCRRNRPAGCRCLIICPSCLTPSLMAAPYIFRRV